MHCFQKDPIKRATAAELMQHRWLRHAVPTAAVNKPQRYENMLPIPRKAPKKEFKNDTISKNISKTPLSDDALLYPKELNGREKMHKFHSTSIGKSAKVETCYGCRKTISEGEARCCKGIFIFFYGLIFFLPILVL
jgi:serine/threonine protein kinase